MSYWGEPGEAPAWTGFIEGSALGVIIGAGIFGFLGWAPVLLCAGVILVALGCGVFAYSEGRKEGE